MDKLRRYFGRYLRGPLTVPRGSLYVALVVALIGIVTLTPGIFVVAVLLWPVGTWGVRYDERRLRDRAR